jgi:hypothetical protein
VEPIAQQGSGRSVRQRWKAIGLGGIEGYVWGRAAALGEPSAGLVIAAFGVFEPTSLARTYEAARAKASRAAVLACRQQGASESLAEILGSSSEVGWIAERLLDVVVGLDATGRPLFSGLRDLPVPGDSYGRLWRATDLVREHRGDGHLAACISAGLKAVEMNVLTELWIGYEPGEYSSTRRHSVESIELTLQAFEERGWWDGTALTPDGRTARNAIEAATDASQQQLVERLGSDINRVIRIASEMAEAIIAAGAFTDDQRKRAAG